ncbi:glycosyltransferase family 4 protein [Rariglobus hedericola]|uniref:Glycosyltransferase family 4 protein n=1 Tax=Rariglobus hedericola TaxID=2597822 RepID=A0A556QPX8_9BACT|nr:glycosyltransferase family 4 protein [Rariglobus hedericola]TSJ78695.1 glycosyltransferase family 4 protein [Rariglobus hedericola]
MVSHPIQYYSPWFRWMSAHGWTLRVFFLWDFGVVKKTDREFGRELAWDVDLLSGYEHEFVPNAARDPGTHHLRGLNNPSLNHRIQQWKPDAILVFGYKYVSHLKLILSTDTPLIFRGDSHLLDVPAPRPLKRGLLRCLYARFSAITYVGLANRDYFRTFGVPEKKLFHVPHCVNAEHFVASESNRAQAVALKESLGLSGCKILLFAGKLIPKKQPRELLAAFLSTDVTTGDAALVFVGEGEELAALRQLAATRTDKLVRFLPFANQSEMPSRYLLANIFALPSRGPEETWGLAVNEAMHLGVPCLVSDRVGCQRDLVTDKETGWVFSVDTPDGLRDALHRAFADIDRDAEGFRQRVAARIAGYTYATATKGLALAVQHAVAPSGRVV